MTAVTQSVSGSQQTPGTAQAEAKPVSRTWAAIAFGVSSLVTAGLAVGGGWISHHYEQQQDQRQEDLKSFREVADKLDPLFRDFVPTYLATASVNADGSHRTAQPLDSAALLAKVELIQSNIQQQDAILERLEMSVLGDDIRVVQDYRKKNIELSALLDRLPPVEESPPLMKAIERARDSRVAVLQTLQKRASSLIYRPSANSTGSSIKK
ncbi:hypothetical protein [Sphingomonas molluscorum]|uniref:hypothetical protein n=1 Tax=Sphingomonas molluscorum TaxID=418184 RepID=UPI0031DD891D